MSAFLGPIHYWLYNKIKIQNNLVEEIISFAKENNIDIKNELDNKFGAIDTRPLEELIDTTNIHGWLQECVSVVEYRLAYAVTTLLKEDNGNLDKLKELFYTNGVKASQLEKEASLEKIFSEMNDTLLDGMPCDHANEVVSQDNNQVTWKRNVCVHGDYWNAVGGNILNYYTLREEFMKGLVRKYDVTFNKIDDVTYQISR